MTKKHFTILIAAIGLAVVLGFQFAPNSEKNAEIFTIYLVRHSEKNVTSGNPGDPPLTSCGEQRSEHLSNFLSDVPLDAIYSTDYTRTKNTAQPTANAKKINIQEYDAQDLDNFARLLIDAKQDALIVGHSNTTGVLAGLLVGEQIGAFDESIYNRIYQVAIHKKCSRLHIFHTAFSCDH